MPAVHQVGRVPPPGTDRLRPRQGDLRPCPIDILSGDDDSCPCNCARSFIRAASAAAPAAFKTTLASLVFGLDAAELSILLGSFSKIGWQAKLLRHGGNMV